MKTVEIHTDGACHGNNQTKESRIGGYGIVFILGEQEKELKGHLLDVTNNQAELQAAIIALNALKVKCKVNLYSDSQYVVKGYMEWLKGWKKRGWKSSTGEPVKNKEYWILLDEASSKHDVTFIWEKGHAGNVYNERCDELALAAILEYKNSIKIS